MTKRRRVSKAGLVALFKAHGGCCHICSGKISVGEKWERSHPIALELGGKDDESNWAPAHIKCHANRTAKEDIPAIAKAKRREALHVGAARPAGKIASAPFPSKPKREPRQGLPPRILFRQKRKGEQ